MDDGMTTRRRWLGAAAATTLGATVGHAIAADTLPTTATGSDKTMAGARVFNVRDFGAKGDGKITDTAAIQAAVDACATDGGGVVLVPAGEFVIGPVRLKSNVALRIVAGGKLVGTIDRALYHPADGIPINGDHTMGDGNV